MKEETNETRTTTMMPGQLVFIAIWENGARSVHDDEDDVPEEAVAVKQYMCVECLEEDRCKDHEDGE